MSNAQARVLRSLDTLSFGELVLKPTAVGDTAPKDATDSAFTATASTVDLGFWECFTTARHGVNEVILVLEGKATLVSDTGERLDHEAGDMVLIPNGWSGVWEIHEHFRKQYISISA